MLTANVSKWIYPIHVAKLLAFKIFLHEIACLLWIELGASNQVSGLKS